MRSFEDVVGLGQISIEIRRYGHILIIARDITIDRIQR